MESLKRKNTGRLRRKRSTRARIKKVSKVPRLSVCRSNQHIYAQIIDDAAGRTLAHVGTCGGALKDGLEGKKKSGNRAEKWPAITLHTSVIATALGELAAQALFEVSFDDFAGRVSLHFADQHEKLRDLVLGQPVAAEIPKMVAPYLGAGGHRRHRHLAMQRMRPGEHRRFHHLGVRQQNILDLDGIEFDAVDIDHVVGAAL